MTRGREPGSARERFASFVDVDSYVRADERHELAQAATPLYVVSAAVDEVGPEGYGPQIVYWLHGPWADRERVLTLAATRHRRRQASELRAALALSSMLGPFRLERQPSRKHPERFLWSLVPMTPDEQLTLRSGDES
jgi:hypothetical protein